MSGGDENFLKRWSRLKQERREEAKAAPESEEKNKKQAKPPAKDSATPTGADEGDPKVVAELPPIESLGKDSDYKPFMRAGVPQALRLAALRKMWASDPLIATPDPFEMHSVDFTHLAAPGQAVKTAYQVGRGFVDAVDKTADRLEGRGEPATKPAATATSAREDEKSDSPAPPAENRKPKSKV